MDLISVLQLLCNVVVVVVLLQLSSMTSKTSRPNYIDIASEIGSARLVREIACSVGARAVSVRAH